MGYIVPLLIVNSILIDIYFSNLIYIGVIFNSYNYWYLLSYSNQFTLHYSIIIYYLFFIYISLLVFSCIYLVFVVFIYYYLLVILCYLLIIRSFLYSFFSNYTFIIPIYIDFFLIFNTFFFKGPINSIEVFIGLNSCYSILYLSFFTLFFQITFIILLIIISYLLFVFIIYLPFSGSFIFDLYWIIIRIYIY